MPLRRDSTVDVNPDHDYVRRQIRNLIDFARRLLAQTLAAEQVEETLAELHRAAAFALGASHTALEQLSVDAAARALDNPERLRGYAAVCATEAEILFRARRLPESTRQAMRAADLYRELLRSLPNDAQATEALHALADLLP